MKEYLIEAKLEPVKFDSTEQGDELRDERVFTGRRLAYLERPLPGSYYNLQLNWQPSAAEAQVP